MTITPFAISGFLGGIFSLSFGLLVLVKSRNKRLGRIWCLFCLSVAAWEFGVLWIGLSNDAVTGLRAWRFGYAFGVVWIATLFFHFVCIFCDLKRPKTILFHYLISCTYFFLVATQYFFRSSVLMFNSLYIPLHGWTYPVFVIWWLTFVGYSHIELWRVYRTANATKRAQIRYFFLGTAIGFCGGSMSYLPNFGISVYPWGNFTVFLYPIIMSYAIIRFNLMDLKIFLRRTVLIISVYSALLLISAPIFYFFHVRHLQTSSGFFLPIEIFSLSLILSTGPFLWTYFVRRSAYFQEYALAGLAHELKSPLAVIENALEFLSNRQDTEQMTNAQLKDYLQMIQRNSSRLQLFVNDLIHAFHMGPKDSLLMKQEFDLQQTIRKILRDHTERKSFQSPVTFNEIQTPLVVRADSAKISQVFSNIFSNAIKFSDGKPITVSVIRSGSEVTISVKDEGLGIPPEEMPNVFDRFYQGISGQKKRGTGIGLTIAKIWVEAHGGKIWAESEGEGKGTAVSFTLPVS